MSIIATYTTPTNYSVKLEVDGKKIASMVTRNSKLWREYDVDSLDIRDNDWDYTAPILPTLKDLKTKKHTAVISWRNLEENKPNQTVIVDNIQWDADPASRDRILSTLQSAFTPPFWTDAENVDQPITREQLQAVHTAIVQFGFVIHARQRKMKADINALETVEAVNNYLIGWPE